jgi:hypothetical protein
MRRGGLLFVDAVKSEEKERARRTCGFRFRGRPKQAYAPSPVISSATGGSFSGPAQGLREALLVLVSIWEQLL